VSPLDSSIPYYPVNDFGPLMKGLVIGGVGSSPARSCARRRGSR
jgi:hypothetical protein